MSREIKFRAWDKDAESMLQPNLVAALIEGKEVACYPTKLLRPSSHPAPTVDVVLRRGNPFAMKDFVLMQYTGLQDARGTEIYEGDILCCHAPMIDRRTVSEVRWSHALLCWDMGSGENTLANLSDWFNDIEVIGNIYEHRHLLEPTS